jgi:C4-type Zn-finger protein
MKKSKYVKQGYCPSCGSNQLKYNEDIIDGEYLTYLYQCNSCSFEGEENYTIEFNSHQYYVSPQEGYDVMYPGESLLQDRLSFAEFQAKHKKGRKKK